MFTKYKGFFAFCGAVSGIWGTVSFIIDIGKGAVYLIETDSINITYGFIYGLLISIGAVTFLWLVSQIIPWIYNNKNFFKIEPDESINDAINYIVSKSKYGKSLDYKQSGYENAAQALKHQVEKGHIKIFGTNKETPIQHEIKIFKNFSLDIKIFRDVNTGYYSKSVIKDEDKTMYDGLSISRKQLIKFFPPVYKHDIY